MVSSRKDNLCPHCDVPKDVLHVLINCGMERKREYFKKQYSRYSKNYAEQSETVQIRELLNMNYQCHGDDKPLAQNSICSFVNDYIVIM